MSRSSELSDSDLSDQYSFSSSPSPESDMSEGEEKAEDTSVSSETSPKAKEKKKKKRKLIPGVVYLSRIPPYMKPHKLKHLLSPYGRVGHVYLQPEGKL